MSILQQSRATSRPRPARAGIRWIPAALPEPAKQSPVRLQAFGFVATGMFISHIYNWLAWRKFYEGSSWHRTISAKDREGRRER